MKYTSIERVQQGDKLGKHIFASDGRILLNEGVQLTIGLLSKLRRMGVNAVYLKDDRLNDVVIEEVVSETTKREAVETLSEAFQFIQSGKNFDSQEVSSTASKLIEEILANKDVLVNLTDIRTNDNHLFVHSVNVCIISVIVAIQLGLEPKRIQELAIGALLHDIGKIIPDETTQEELHNDHTWKGFNFLRKSKEISTLSAHVALTHHEHIDGSGHPRKLKGDDIHFFAKIVAVANYYDNLISSVTANGHLPPHEACERIMGLTNISFDHNIVWRFLRCIAFYPTGSQVKLSTGETGVVVSQHRGLPQRPIIRIFKLDQGTYGGDDFQMKEVDLAKETTIFIKEAMM